MFGTKLIHQPTSGSKKRTWHTDNGCFTSVLDCLYSIVHPAFQSRIIRTILLLRAKINILDSPQEAPSLILAKSCCLKQSNNEFHKN